MCLGVYTDTHNLRLNMDNEDSIVTFVQLKRVSSNFKVVFNALTSNGI